jgi:hypothetical protein
MGDTTPRIAKTPKKTKMGGKSKKSYQHVHNISINKYGRQKIRTLNNKLRAWKRHLKKHVNDLQNKKAIETIYKTI